MPRPSRRLGLLAVVALLPCHAVEQHDEVFRVHAMYNEAFFWRHPDAYRSGAAIHVAHGAQHDELLVHGNTARERDRAFDAFCVGHLQDPPLVEPTQEYYAPYTARTMWRLLRTIEWTHILHEETYDILASRRIAWQDKGDELERVVGHYLRNNDVALSCAPLDLVMRRTGAMMKPYFTVFRTHHPASNNFFYAAHWWHPAIYEAMMIAGDGPGQEEAVTAVQAVFMGQVVVDRPHRMLLSREMMPLYARLSPESSNIFDNLHMLHGLAYDILAYHPWSLDEKRREIERVLQAMAYRPGDEQWARKFPLSRPQINPRTYEEWMRKGPGEMGRIMVEMHEEMMPPADEDAKESHTRMTRILLQKLMPGQQEEEPAGSFVAAMNTLMPDMPMEHTSMGAGRSDPMSERLARQWESKAAAMPDAAPYTMPPALENR